MLARSFIVLSMLMLSVLIVTSCKSGDKASEEATTLPATPVTTAPPISVPTSILVSRHVSTPHSATASTKAPEEFDGMKCTTSSNPQPRFTHPIIDNDLISETMPPGLAATGMLKPHGYFFVKKNKGDSFSEGGWVGYPRAVPVYAPIRSRLRLVHSYTSGAYGKNLPEPPVEYMLLFEVSCEVYYKLDHLGPLAEVIEAAGPFPIGVSTHLDIPIEIPGGELVSYWSGVNPGGNVDIGVYNTTIENTFVNNDRYTDGYHDSWLNEDCPFDYFPEELRDRYYSLFIDKNSGDLVGTRPCRTSAESDVPGTIKGAWFEPGRYGSVFSVSTSLSGWVVVTFAKHAETDAPFGIYLTLEDATYMEPSKVTSEHCYQGYAQYWQKEDPTYVNLKLVSPTELQVEYGAGTCTKRTQIETLALER